MTTQTDTVLTQDLGNTRTRSRGWCLTLNNWKQDEYDALKKYADTLTHYIIGKEKGVRKTDHLQVYLYNKNAISFDSVKKIVPRAHIEKAKGSISDNLKYCSKDNDYITNIPMEEKLIDPLEGKTLYKWQEDLITILNGESYNRKLYWYWERNGNIGKTSFVKSWIINNPDVSICLSGKGADIKSGVATHIQKKKRLKYAFFHYTRSIEEFVSYDAMESVKDGMFFSGKYESSMVVFNQPHVIVFANFPPNETRCSVDRWISVEITP